MYPKLYIDFTINQTIPASLKCDRAGTTANHFNASGTLVQSLEDRPRIGVNGLIIEPRSTNLFLHSRDLTTFTKTGTATVSNWPSLNGSLRPIKISSFASSGTVIFEQTISVSGTNTLSFYADCSSIRFTMYVEFGNATAYVNGGGKRKYTLTTTTGATSVKFIISNIGTVSSDYVIIDAVQVEAGNRSTTPIHTSGSTVTRNADNVYIDISQTAVNNWFSALNGTFLIDFQTSKCTSEETILYLTNTGGGLTEYMKLGVKRTGGTAVNNGYNNSVDFGFFSACDTPTENWRLGTTYAYGEQFVSLVGRSPISGTQNQQIIDFSDINRLYIGRTSAGANLFCGTVRRLGYYNNFVDQFELNNLTNL